jgi:BirA family transcriptional regulator, biotin operon repressor / biotin---[acetyl-CoA-carboxylase] ligase
MQPGALAEALYTALEPLWPGLDVDVRAETDSTNTQLLQRGREGITEPCLMLALSQTAGRGRMGRAWQAEPGASVMLSLARPLAPADWSGLSLAMGLALAEALHPDIHLKWPNDLWLGQGSAGRKLGGVLVETAGLAHSAAPQARWCVVGVGLNITPRSPEGLRTPPAALRELLPLCEVADVALTAALALAKAMLKFEAQGFAPLQARFNARDALAGCTVQAGAASGLAQGVSASGALLVHTGSSVVPITSDEVSVSAQSPGLS